MEKRISDIQAIVRTLETENHKLICQNQHLKKSLSHSKGKFKELDVADKNEKKQLMWELNRVTTELKSSQSTVLQLDENNILLKDLLVEKEALIKRMETEINELKAELTNTKNVMDEISKDHDNLGRALIEYERLSEESRAKNYNDDKQDDTKQKLKYFQNQCKKIKLCKEQTEKALSDAKEEAKKLKNELHKTQEQNRQIKMENIRLGDEMYELKKEVNNYRKEWKITEQNLTNVKIDYDHYRESIEKLKTREPVRQKTKKRPENPVISQTSHGDTRAVRANECLDKIGC